MNVILRPFRSFLTRKMKSRKKLFRSARDKRLDYELLKMRKIGQNIIVQAGK